MSKALPIQPTFGEIVDMLKLRVNDIVPHILLGAKKIGPRWVVGSLAGEAGQSLSIRANGGSECGNWKEHNGSERGDILDLIRLTLFAGDKRQAIVWARGYLGLSDIDPEKMAVMRREAVDMRAKEDAKEAKFKEKKRETALGFFIGSAKLAGTMGERYLLDRNIGMPIGGWPGALKFNPGMYHSETKLKHPCLLAYICRGDGQFMTVHRIYLEKLPDGKVIKLSSVEKPKMVYGSFAGGFVPISKGGSKLSLSKMKPDERLIVIEGIEDALIMALACPDRRIVAAVSLGNVGAIAEFLPDNCRDVMLIKDNDKSAAAKMGFERALKAHCIAGRVVRVGSAPLEFKDINDWLDSLIILDRENVND